MNNLKVLTASIVTAMFFLGLSAFLAKGNVTKFLIFNFIFNIVLPIVLMVVFNEYSKGNKNDSVK